MDIQPYYNIPHMFNTDDAFSTETGLELGRIFGPVR